MERQEFAIERFRLQPGRRLLRDGAPIALGPKPLSILTILVQARGMIVTKDELMQKAWPGQVIEENALHAQISAVRRALGEDAGWIVTASGHGLQLFRTCRDGRDRVPNQTDRIGRRHRGW